MGAQELTARLSEHPEAILAHAIRLADADESMLYQLVKARKDSGLSQRDVAEILGIKQSSVAAFERHDNDPRLSTIRRYALAVGVHVDHHVSFEPEVAWHAYSTEFRVGTAAWPTQFSLAAPAVGECQTDFAYAA